MKSTTKKKTVSNENKILTALAGLDKNMSGLENRMSGFGDSLLNLEKRLTMQLTNQIESATRNFKEYTDSIATRLERRINDVQHELKDFRLETKQRFLLLETKAEINKNGLVDLIERRAGEEVRLEKKLNDHERRLTLLESKN